MKRTWMLLLGLFVIIVGSSAIWIAIREDDRTLAGEEKIRVQLTWTAGAQFIGFYVANAKDYYAREGLSVEFKHGGPDVDPLRNLELDDADFALATADQVLIRADAHDKALTNVALKVVGTVFNRNLACFMSKRTSNIRTPADLTGKTIGVFPSYDTENILLCLLKRNGISKSQVQLRNFPTFAGFADGDPEVLGSYLINEPLVAHEQDIATDILDPNNYGVFFYSDSIVTKQSYYKDHRDTIRRFLRASARGWSYAENNPEDALRLMFGEVRGAIGEGAPRQLQEKKLAEVVKYLRDGPDRKLFYMNHKTWTEMENSLHEIGRISKTGYINTLCDFNIVDEATP